MHDFASGVEAVFVLASDHGREADFNRIHKGGVYMELRHVVHLQQGIVGLIANEKSKYFQYFLCALWVELQVNFGKQMENQV